MLCTQQVNQQHTMQFILLFTLVDIFSIYDDYAFDAHNDALDYAINLMQS